MPDLEALLVLPRLRVQNANAVSGPLTWGFPALSAFVGLMLALERRLPNDIELMFDGVGVICHDHQAQVSERGFPRKLHLSRNPVDKSGDTAAIVEEGRIHLDITLVFAVTGDLCDRSDTDQQAAALALDDIVQGMRVAGGTVVPPPKGRWRPRPYLAPMGVTEEECDRRFKRLRHRWLPGFALVGADDVLSEHLRSLREERADATPLDAWLDLSRLNYECRVEAGDGAQGSGHERVSWEVRRRPGWIVPVPVGYSALADLSEPGTVANARDASTPLRFVESLYSLGEWVSPHRLRRPDDLLWYVDNDLDAGLYRLKNDYRRLAYA